jgi:hypothetical protein
MEIVPAGQTAAHNPQPIQEPESMIVVTEFCIYQKKTLPGAGEAKSEGSRNLPLSDAI